MWSVRVAILALLLVCIGSYLVGKLYTLDVVSAPHTLIR